MSLRVLTIALVLILLISAVVIADDREEIVIQKQELDAIQKEVEAGHLKLDSLKRAEQDLRDRIKTSDNKIAGNRKVLGDLTKEADRLKAEIASSETALDQHSLSLDLSRRRYLGNIRQFYLAAHGPVELFSEDANEELRLQRQVTYLTAVAGFESGLVDQASELLGESEQRLGQLSGEKGKVEEARKKREKANRREIDQHKKREKDLAEVRHTKTEETDRVLTLEIAAREMAQIIERLQLEARQRELGRQGAVDASIFASLKGQLLSPYKGKIVSAYGSMVDPVTNLKSFNPGITINGQAGSKVVAVASGTVVWVGDLRGYGVFVIIRHDEEYFTTYAGLGQTFVTTNEYILAGNRLATSGADGVVKFELRQGSKALDPVKWINIESL